MLLIIKRSIILLTLLLTVLSASGQAFYFRHFQAENGLTHNTVFSLLQDKNGFIWIGTKSGLNRFDGYSFKSISNSNSIGSLSDITINSICEDLNGLIWIATGSGLFRYDQTDESLHKIYKSEDFDISYLRCDRENNLWFISREKLFRFNYKTRLFTYKGVLATCFSIDSLGDMWLGDSKGFLKKLNIKTNNLSQFEIFDKSIGQNLKAISKVFCSGTEVLVGTTKQGLQSYDVQARKLKPVISKNKDGTEVYIRDIIGGEGNNCWIASESGIYRYNAETGEIINLKKRPDDPYSISDNAVYALCKDKEGGIWAGTFFGGLNYFSRETSKFEKYYPLSSKNSLSGSAVREIHSIDGKEIWIGTEDAGLNKFNINTGQFSIYTSNGQPLSLSYPNIHGLLADKRAIYVGPYLHGLEVINPATGNVKNRFTLLKSTGSNSSDFVMCIYKTAENTILIGTVGGGLLAFDEKGKRFNKYPYFPKSDFIYSITQDHKGFVWAGSLTDGAYFYHPVTGENGNIRFYGRRDRGKESDFLIQGIMEDSNGRLWFSTEGGGLIRLEKDRKTFKKFSTKTGFPTNNVYRALEDKRGRLWISSLKGLICFNLENDHFKVYTQANGLLTDQFNYNSAYKAPDGKMYFGCVKGMISFKPESFNGSHNPPALYFTGFQIDNREVIPGRSSILKKSINYTDTVILNYNQSNFNIEFAALSYSSPSVVKYKYKMTGLDKNWTYLSSNRRAYFTDLSPGNYSFTVIAESNVGNWPAQEKVLHIKVLPPIWKSKWAYLIYTISLALLVYYSIRYYKIRMERKNRSKLQLYELEKEREVYQAKIEFFTTIAHEIQTPLTLIQGPTERALKRIEEVPSIRKNLLMIEKNTMRLLELTRQLLDFRKAEINQFELNFVKVDLILLLKHQVTIFKEDAAKKAINIVENLPKEPFYAFVDREALIKITSNLLSNSVKYCQALVEVKFIVPQVDEQTFTIRFINDGPGISNAERLKVFEPFYRAANGRNKPGTGIGLSLAKSLTDLHGGSLKLLNTHNELTIFELTLPIRQKFEFVLGK
ncbi:ligand-binding sensor domain-containing protein [Desertivirga arenae]|uniref:ligand-binding sensor domain-containing protein n=1 Tax=Desertivirga arenae TaxID=2810309 RepID=UPI001A95D88B|nr:sensor histidine kinase [Pedobacter sp. SYSU D00823]